MVNPVWTVEAGLDRVETYIESLNIPVLNIDVEKREDISFGQLASLSNKQLEEYLSASGAWTAYLEIKLAEIGAKKGAFKTAYEAGLARSLFETSLKYRESDKKKPTKEELVGQVLKENDKISQALKHLIELEATYDRLLGMRDAYKALFMTASRIISLRSLQGV